MRRNHFETSLPLSFPDWLARMPRVWRDAFTRGRVDTRTVFAKESTDLDEISRHVIAARDIGAGAV